MIIAHLPAGYLLHRALPPSFPGWAVMLGSVCPDFDMALIWSGLLVKHHHLFLTHRPAVWLLALALCLAMRHRVATAIALGGLLHICLDSVGGRIDWAWPFGSYILGLIDIPRQQGWWVWSFVNHPIFMIELTICLTAFALFVTTRLRPRSPRLSQAKTT